MDLKGFNPAHDYSGTFYTGMKIFSEKLLKKESKGTF